MVRTPPKLRSRGKPAVTDKSSAEPSLSVDSDPASDSEMSLSAASKSLVEDYVNKHLGRSDIIDTIVSKIADRLKEVVAEAVAAAMREANQEIGRLRGEVKTLTDTVDSLSEKMRLRTDDLEQYQRRNNLRVFGVPEKAGEDTDKLVQQIVNEELLVDLPLESIERSHRVGKQQDLGPDGKPRHRAIIVRFASYRDRRRVFEAKKLLKGTGMTIREDLTTYRLQVYKAAADKFGAFNTWTMDGRTKWVTGKGANKKVNTADRLADIN